MNALANINDHKNQLLLSDPLPLNSLLIDILNRNNAKAQMSISPCLCVFAVKFLFILPPLP